MGIRDFSFRDFSLRFLGLGFYITVAAATGFLLMEELEDHSYGTEVEENRDFVARLISTNGSVLVKPGSFTNWKNISPPQLFSSGDLIYTRADALAEVTFNDGSRIHVEEESMIEILGEKGEYSVRLLKGQLLAQGNSSQVRLFTEEVEVQTKSGAEIHLKAGRDKNSEVVMKKGEAKLVSKDKKEMALSTKKMVQVDTEGKLKSIDLLVVLDKPGDGALIEDLRSSVEVPFKWTTLAPEIESEIFQMSSSPSFPKENTVELEAHQGVTATVFRGKQFWRVGWKSGEKLYFTRPFYLKLQSKLKIELAQPVSGAVFEFPQGQDEVDFQWQELEGVDHYLLEIFKDRSLTSLQESLKTKESLVTRSFTFPGTFYWKVSAYDEKNEMIAQSLARKLSVERALPALPRLLEPLAGSQWTWSDPVKFSWEPDQRAKSYKILLSKDAKQKRLIESRLLRKSHYLWAWRGAQTYYWSVISMDEKGKIIGKSEVRSFQVTSAKPVMPITLLRPDHKKRISRPMQEVVEPIVFEWKANKERENSRYTFRISESPNFKKALEKKGLREERLKIPFKRSGDYYWQVLRTSKDRPGDIERSAVYNLRYRISTYLLPPKLVKPENRLKKTKFKKISLDFFWQPVKGADTYRWTLKKMNQRTSKKEIVAEKTLTGIEHQSEELGGGLYFWSVKALDEKGREGTSSEIREFEIEINKELVTPQLAPPKLEE